MTRSIEGASLSVARARHSTVSTKVANLGHAMRSVSARCGTLRAARPARRTHLVEVSAPVELRCEWQLMSPGTANFAGASIERDRSPFGVFGIRERLPTQVMSPSSMTIAASDIALVPSKRPSISSTVRIAWQYRRPVPHPLVERLRARGFVMPDYDGGGLLNVPATVLDVLGARDAGDAPPLVALDPKLREGVRQVVVILADGLGWWQLEMFCDQGHMPFLAELRERARRPRARAAHEATTVFQATRPRRSPR